MRPALRSIALLACIAAGGCARPHNAVGIVVAADAPAGLQDTARDAAALLGTLLHQPVPVGPGVGGKQVIALRLKDGACPAAGKGADAYAIAPQKETVVVCSDGQLGVEFGLYALLEQNGLRFFHPQDTFIPAAAPERLTATATVAAPLFAHRGFHLHTVHPIPMLSALHFGGPVNQHLVDDYLRWLVRNRQNYLQWAFIQVPDMEGALAEARYAVDRGHALGLEVGINTLLWGGGLSSLQNDYALFNSSDPNWKSALDASLDWLLKVPFDRLDLGLGEFEQTSDTALVDWVNEAQQHAEAISPRTQVVWTSHVGNVGNSAHYGVYYYFVPQFSTPKVGLFVHTVMLYDLNGPAPAYNQTDFHLQRDFLLQQQGQRATWFFPESAYWLTTDSPIPVWMSGYLQGRANDLSYLAQAGVPGGLQGHLTFTSADEWDYWLIDYLIAHQSYDGPQGLEQFLGATFAPLGAGGRALGQLAAAEATTQWSDLVEKNLLPYLAGEDAYDRLGYKSGIYNHPPRVPFTTVLAMDAAGLDAFSAQTLAGVEALAAHERAALQQVQGVAGQLAANGEGYRAELADGFEVTALRAEHSLAMYRAVVAKARTRLDGVDRSAEIAAQVAQAKALTAQAAAVVARREPHYRLGAVETQAGHNPTQYPYAALYNAHALTYWTSQEDDLAAALAQ